MFALARWLPIFVGCVLTAIPFYRPLLFSDRALLFRDLTRDFLPSKFLWAKSVASGEGIPYWNHFVHAGTPYYAVNTTSPLHPLNFLFLLADPVKAAVYFIWAHYLALFFGFYLLARSFKADRWTAMVLGSAVPLSGLMLSVHSLAHFVASAAAVPFWLLGAMGLERRNGLSVWLTGAAIGWPILAGDPQFSYIMAIGTLFFVYRLPAPGLLQKTVVYATIGISAVLFSAIQLFPTLGFMIGSNRMNMKVEEAMSFSLHPLRLIEAFVPLAFGNRFGPDSSYLGADLVNFFYKNPFVFSIYPGFFLLLLAGTKPWRDKRQIYYLVGAAVVLCLSFGSFLSPSPYEMVASVLPGMQLFRYPERLVFWVFLFLWLAAARTLLFFPADEGGRKYVSFPVVVLAVGLGTLFVFRFGFFEIPAKWHLGAASTTVMALCWICLRWRKSESEKKILLYFGLATLVADALLTGQRLVWDQSKNTLDIRRYPLAEKIAKDLSRAESDGAEARRLFSLFSHQQLMWTGSQDYSTSTTNYSLHALLPNTAVFYGIEEAMGYLSFQDADRERFIKDFLLPKPEEVDPRILIDVMAVRYLPRPTIDGTIELSINATAQPYVFFPAGVHFAEDTAAATQVMRSAAYRSSQDLVLLSAESKDRKDQSPARKIKILKRNGREISLQIEGGSPSPQYLLLNESFNANWVAETDRLPLRIERGNQWAMAVLLPASTEDSRIVNFRYRDPLIPLGQGMGALWLLATMGLYAWGKRPRRSVRNK